MANLTFSNINTSEDPFDIAAATGSRYEGIQRFKDKELYLFTDLTTGSTFSFFPDQVTIEFVDRYLKEKRKEFNRVAWQIQKEEYTFDELKEVIGPNQIWKVSKTPSMEREYFVTGPNAYVDSVDTPRNAFYIYDGMYSAEPKFHTSLFEGAGTIRRVMEPFKLISGEPKFSNLKFSWQMHATPIDMKDAEAGDIIIWKDAPGRYGARDIITIMPGDMGTVVGLSPSATIAYVAFFNQPTIKELLSPALNKGFIVETKNVDIFRAYDLNSIPVGDYKISSLKTASEEQAIFINLWIPDDVKEKLLGIKDLDDDLHVTLVYRPPLKQTEEQNKELLQKLVDIAKEYKDIKVDFGGTAQFDNIDNSDVALVNIVEGPELFIKLVNVIEEVYGKWERKFGFTPHITIHAKGDGEVPDIESFSWKAKHIGVTFGSTIDYEPDNDTKIYTIELGTGKVEETLEKRAWQIQKEIIIYKSKEEDISFLPLSLGILQERNLDGLYKVKRIDRGPAIKSLTDVLNSEFRDRYLYGDRINLDPDIIDFIRDEDILERFDIAILPSEISESSLKLSWQMQPKFIVNVDDYERRIELGKTEEEAIWITKSLGLAIGKFINGQGSHAKGFFTNYDIIINKESFNTYEEAREFAKDYAHTHDIGWMVGINDYEKGSTLGSLKFSDPLTYTDTSGINDGQSMKDKSLMFHTEEATDIDIPVDTMWLEPDVNFNAPSNENLVNRLDVNDNTILENERKRKETLTWQIQLTKTYEGGYALSDIGHIAFVRVDGLPLNIVPSLKIWNHSPTGFAWGYSGSGPAQLALAILYDYTGDADLSKKYHQQFKEDFVATWDGGWTITSDEIDDWIEDNILKKQAWLMQQEEKSLKTPESWRDVKKAIKDELDELGYDVGVSVHESAFDGPPASWIVVEMPQEFRDVPETVRKVRVNDILSILKRFDVTTTFYAELDSGNFAFSIED